jgi:ribonuclease VapC
VIVVDTSALMAVVLHEADGAACMASLRGDDRLLISAGTMTEALIVAQRRGYDKQMRDLLDNLAFEIIPVTADTARRAAAAHARWGKGAKPAGLNFGDCFAYVAAKENDCPLLFVGRDFAKTDVKRAIR